MRTKNGFKVRRICGENVVIAEGKENIDFCHIISMNDTSAYLWENVVDKDFDAETLVQLLETRYKIDAETARKDVEELLKSWKSADVIE